jgi:hypothetical protein
MDRNDQVFFGALGGALITAILVAVLTTFRDSGVAAIWTGSLLTGAAVLAAVAVPLLNERRRRLERERTATLAVATQTARWLRAVPELSQDNRNAEAPGNPFDEGVTLRLPTFAFADDLSHVIELRSRLAAVIVKLIEEVERSNSDIAGVLQIADGEFALKAFYRDSARLFRVARRVYLQLAQIAQLPGDPNQDWELDLMVDIWNRNTQVQLKDRSELDT